MHWPVSATSEGGSCCRSCGVPHWPFRGEDSLSHVCVRVLLVRIVMGRILTLLLTMAVLSGIHHSPLLMLTACALLNGAAAYIQMVYVSALSTYPDLTY